MNTCKNCGSELLGPYCHLCRQRADTQAIGFQSVLSEFQEGLLQINRGFFYTAKELFIRPGHSIREYLEGKRIRHFKPISYLLLLSVLYAILVHYLEWGTAIEGLLSGLTASRGDQGTESSMVAYILSWLIANYQYSSLIYLPIWALASYSAFFKKPYNYFEHFFLVTYLTGQGTLISIFILLIASIFPTYKDQLSNALIINFIYYIWAYTQFFHPSPKFVVILRTLLSFVLFLLILVAILFLLSTVDHL